MRLDIKLSNDVKISILLNDMDHIAGKSGLYELYADIPLDKKILKQIIEAGIKSLSDTDKRKLLNDYNNYWEENDYY